MERKIVHNLFSSLLFTFFIILILLKIFGDIFKRLNQPKVVGEMIAGILLGPSFMGFFFPTLSKNIFSPNILLCISSISNFGLTIYMFLIGMELGNMEFNKGKGKQIINFSFFSFLPPFLMGILTSLFLIDKYGGPHPVIFSVFLGLIMSITALPVIARILQEKKLMSKNLGSIILIVAGIDDIIAWTILAFALSTLQAKHLTNGFFTFGGTVLFFLITIYGIKPWVNSVIQKVENQSLICTQQIAFILTLILGASSITEYIGIHAFFGAFILGICMPKSQRLQSELKIRLEPLITILFMPLYFINSGLNTDFTKILFNSNLLLPLFMIVIVSCLSKYGFGTLAIRRLGFSWSEASAFGGLLNAKGVVGLVLANIGKSTGVINIEIFTILIIMIIISTLLVSPIYHLSLSDLSRRSFSYDLFKEK